MVWFVYLDEFGHDGPFVSTRHPKHNTHPAFGFGGIILPEEEVRNFSTYFYQLKSNVLAHDLVTVGNPHHWEKKGTNFFTRKSILKYHQIRSTGTRLINTIESKGGRIFFFGKEKSTSISRPNPIGLRTTVLSQTIRRIDRFLRGGKFCIILDEHSAHSDQLKCAQQTMFGSEPARGLVSPPFEVKSFLDQNMQAADWIACIVGRISAYQLNSGEFEDLYPYNKYFGLRLSQVKTRNSLIVTRGHPTRFPDMDRSILKPDPHFPLSRGNKITMHDLVDAN